MSTALWAGPLADMTLYVEIAFGADLTDSDGSGWSWTDVTTDVRQDPGISTTLGRADEQARSQPAELSLVLDNAEGAYSLGGAGSHFPYVRQGTPVRVRVDPDDGSGARVLFLGYAVGWTPTWGGLGQAPAVQLEAAGYLRRLQGSAQPFASVLRRRFANPSVGVAYWPLEEEPLATYGLNDRGGSNLIYSGTPKWASDSDFVASAPLPDAGTAAFIAQVNPYTATGEVQVVMMVNFPASGLADGTVLMHVSVTGTISRVDITYESPGNIGVFAYNADGTLHTSVTGSPNVNGLRGLLSVEISQVGANVSAAARFMRQDPNYTALESLAGFTMTTETVNLATQIELFPHGDADGVTFGHLLVLDDITNLATFRLDVQAWFGQTGAAPGNRLALVCVAAGVALTAYQGSTTGDLPYDEEMGFQTVGALLDVLREIETHDHGQLWDGINPGISYTTRRYREDGDVALVIDAPGGQLAPPITPTDDDQRVTNRAVVTRSFGVSAVYEDEDGPRGSQTIGLYESSLTVSDSSDARTVQHAAFMVSLGTVEGLRVPTLTMELAACPDLAPAALDLIPGDRVQVLDPSAVLPGLASTTLDLLVEGIGHELSAGRWTVTLQCSPASPWLAARIAAASGDTSEFVFRGDTSGSSLAAAAPRNSTALSVATGTGPLWTTTADDYPLTLDVGGVPVRATACSGGSSPQTFTVDPLEYDRASGSTVRLYDQRPLGL